MSSAKEEVTHFGGWEASRRDKLTLGLRATPSERLAWLESMIELGWASGALPRKRTDPWGTRRSESG